MNIKKLPAQQRADANLIKLGDSKHLGQGFVVGLDEQGENLVQICWISRQSQNRILKHDGDGRVYVEFTDPEKNKGFSPLRYNVMREIRRFSHTYAVVSSGNQTDAVAEGFAEDIDIYDSLRRFGYEPYLPNLTPRITAECHWQEDRPIIRMSLLRKSIFSLACDRTSIEINGMGTGFGYGMTTHLSDEESSSLFQDDPSFLVPLRGSVGEIADMYWSTLDLNNEEISLAVKMIPRKHCSQIFLINQ